MFRKNETSATCRKLRFYHGHIIKQAWIWTFCVDGNFIASEINKGRPWRKRTN